MKQTESSNWQSPSRGTWDDHIDIITTKAAKRLYFLRQPKKVGIGSSDLVQFYCTIIRPVIEYV